MRAIWLALTLWCPLMGLAAAQFRPASEADASLQPAIEWAIQQAPRDGIRLRLTYGYRDTFAKVRVDVMGPHTRRWRMAPMEEDPAIYRFFDGFVESQKATKRTWSGVTITVDREQGIYAVVYCDAVMDGVEGQGGFAVRSC